MMLTPIIYNTPLPSDYFKDIYSQLRGIKEIFRERFEFDHYIGVETDPTQADCDGYHKQLTMKGISAPTVPADSMVLYMNTSAKLVLKTSTTEVII